jgi:hypothetical protein
MKKTIGSYVVKLDTNSNLITVSKNNETVFGKVVAPHDSGSFFDQMCTAVQSKVDKGNA